MNNSMDIRLNSCPSGGYLVGAEDWLPQSPSSYHFGAPGVLVGCNQLKCGNCGAKVRGEQGWQRNSRVEFDPADLYEMEDWSKAPDLVKGNSTLYVCRCDYVFVDLPMPMDLNTEMAVETGEDFPQWGCCGHPPFELPGEVAGRQLKDAADVADFAEEILAGAWHKSHPNPVHFGWPGFLLWRLYVRVRDVGLGELISKRALGVLTSDDPVQRAVGIAFFKAFPGAPGGDQLADIYRSHRARFDGVPDPILGFQDLGLLFELALQARASHTHDSAALQIIREYLLADAPLNGLRFQFLKEVDRVWLEEHRDEVLKAAPSLIDHWVHMVRAWPEEVLLQELSAIGRWTPLPPDALRNAVQKQLNEHPEKQQRILAQLQGI